MRKVKLLFLLPLTAIVISCSNQNSENKSTTQSDTVKQSATNSQQTPELPVVDDLANFSDLLPLEIKDSTNKDVFEKYGIEFNGNCYACDLAKIKLTKKDFNFINVCDSTVFHRLENFSYSIDGSTLSIKSAKNEFIFTKIEELPVYKLVVKGEKVNFKKMRLPTYFVNKKDFNKFKEHDCGDFQG